MAFTDKQSRALKAKLSYRHVKTRANNGSTVAYVEGWHVIAEANRIFGYDCWDRQTLSPRCLWSEMQRSQTACFYSTKVRVTVRAAGVNVVREGIGTGMGRSPSAEMAHEIALKAAETDATKRALATFGNPFGLALYDKDHRQVTRPPKEGLRCGKPAVLAPPAAEPTVLVIHFDGGREERFADAEAFVSATLKAVTQLPSIEAVYAFWEKNLASFAALRRQPMANCEDPVGAIVSALKERTRALGRLLETKPASAAERSQAGAPPALAIPKDKRIRDKAHLAFVASQPCLVCGRRPAQAHHLRFAQPRAMGLKVSDEFTVPMCNGHHDSLHRTGDERAWWARNGILDPLKIAARLWAASRQRSVAEEAETPSAPADGETAATSVVADANGPAAAS